MNDIGGPPLDFHAMYRAEFPYVFHSLRRLGVAPRDVEDVAHDVFLAVYRRWSDYDASRPLRPWLFGFAYRIASDHRRSARHRREVVGAEAEPADDARLPDEEVEGERMRKKVLDALDRMDFERRGILVMHDIDGHPVPEIARALAIPLNTAYSRLRLARKDFEKAIRETGRGAP
jgi:RNA polymerase sigma-70 factor (ECF subfamily)